MDFEKVLVVGLGYIGLPTAALIASKGIEVLGVDVNQSVVDTINKGQIHIIEPDLNGLVAHVVGNKKLTASLTPQPADAIMLAVPTPFNEDNTPDLSYIKAAAETIAPVLKKDTLIILESTSPVGATEQLAAWIAEQRPDLCIASEASDKKSIDVNIAYCPERVLPGKVLTELVENDRVIGGLTPNCSKKAASFYRKFVQGECIECNARTAEMSKLTENAFRDVNIAFANELSLICDKLNINVWELIQLANRHPRVNVLSPGPGVGGHCIAVDPWFIVNSAPDQAKLIRTAREVNDGKPQFVIDKVNSKLSEFKKPCVACLGVAFKADIDDLRESPSLDITLQLASQENCKVLVVEPNIKTLPSKLSTSAAKLVSIEQALQEADVFVLLVDHKEFKAMSIDEFDGKPLIDTRGVF